MVDVYSSKMELLYPCENVVARLLIKDKKAIKLKGCEKFTIKLIRENNMKTYNIKINGKDYNILISLQGNNVVLESQINDKCVDKISIPFKLYEKIYKLLDTYDIEKDCSLIYNFEYEYISDELKTYRYVVNRYDDNRFLLNCYDTNIVDDDKNIIIESEKYHKIILTDYILIETYNHFNNDVNHNVGVQKFLKYDGADINYKDRKVKLEYITKISENVYRHNNTISNIDIIDNFKAVICDEYDNVIFNGCVDKFDTFIINKNNVGNYELELTEVCDIKEKFCDICDDEKAEENLCLFIKDFMNLEVFYTNDITFSSNVKNPHYKISNKNNLYKNTNSGEVYHSVHPQFVEMFSISNYFNKADVLKILEEEYIKYLKTKCDNIINLGLNCSLKNCKNLYIYI